ncbi:MAG TPA: biotin/lipoyl-containing protein [Solirubrobacteraceae bacterium]|nr:biotin/lipoyl-containing protein [Solirubrobacteraceae bacterium]
MGLSHDDVREILHLIDTSELAELRVQTEGFSLHVRRDGGVDERLAIPSPMLGTFYRAESPGGTPLVDVGTEVGPETTVCIIEVMKMMNSVPAGVSGTVVEVCARDGELVEYGAPLFRVQPG